MAKQKTGSACECSKTVS